MKERLAIEPRYGKIEIGISEEGRKQFMKSKAIIAAIAGTKDIVVKNIIYDDGNDTLSLEAKVPRREQCRCGICNKKSKYYDKGRGIRKWRGNDVGTTKTYIQTESTRVKCEEHGIVTAAVPWARHKSRFCKTFEETIAWLTVHTSKSAVSAYMRVKWHTIGSICDRVYKELEAQHPSRFDGLIRIGIDETSYRKGHKYMTVVTNHDTGKVIWCDIGYGKETLSKFFELLTPEQCASIQCVSADGARWIADCVKEYCPNAERCIDPFHVVSWATEALDGERRKACSEAQKLAAEAAKKKDSLEMESKLLETKKNGQELSKTQNMLF